MTQSATTHDSEWLFKKGADLITYIEYALEGVIAQKFSWQYTFTNSKHREEITATLHRIFQMHSDYIGLNSERQRLLITDVAAENKTFIISEISVIESQRQTIERLMATYANAVFAKQSEAASLQANRLALLGVLVAVIALAITDLHLQKVLEKL